MENPNLAQLANLLRDYQRMIAIGYRNITNDRYGLNNATTQYQKEQWTKQALILLAQEILLEQRKEAMYSFDEFVQFCSFNNKPCDRRFFKEYYNPVYGACYQFNVENQTNLITYRAGNEFGQIEPDGTQVYLPTTKTSGIRIGTSIDNIEPAIDSFGIDCSVGTDSSISITFVNFINIYNFTLQDDVNFLEEPYGECVKNVNEAYNFYPNRSYNIQHCLRSCKQNRAINYCGCADPKYNKPENISYCDVSARSYFNGDLRRCVNWYRQNSVFLNVHYSNLVYELNSEKESYTILDASNELGGQIGLWLGVSVISIFEVVALIIMLIMFFAYGRRVKLYPSEEELNADVRYRNIQELKQELDKHEVLAEELRVKVVKQIHEQKVKRDQIQGEIVKATDLNNRALASVQAAREALAKQKIPSVQLLAELANAQALANATTRHLKKLNQEYKHLQ